MVTEEWVCVGGGVALSVIVDAVSVSVFSGVTVGVHESDHVMEEVCDALSDAVRVSVVVKEGERVRDLETEGVFEADSVRDDEMVLLGDPVSLAV